MHKIYGLFSTNPKELDAPLCHCPILQTVYPGMDQTTLLMVLKKEDECLPEPSTTDPAPSSSTNNPYELHGNPQVLDAEYSSDKSKDLIPNPGINKDCALKLSDNFRSIEGGIELSLPSIEFSAPEGFSTCEYIPRIDDAGAGSPIRLNGEIKEVCGETGNEKNQVRYSLEGKLRGFV